MAVGLRLMEDLIQVLYELLLKHEKVGSGSMKFILILCAAHSLHKMT
jgi:hypothetical protein